jgi:hypothetical protein
MESGQVAYFEIPAFAWRRVKNVGAVANKVANMCLMFHIVFTVHSDIKSQIKKPTNALYYSVQCICWFFNL